MSYSKSLYSPLTGAGSTGPTGPTGSGSPLAGVTGVSSNGFAGGATFTNDNYLQLGKANVTYPGIVTTGTQNFAGSKTFTSDLTVNTLTIGLGGSDVSLNTVVGYQALANNTKGSYNTSIGYYGLHRNTYGSYNTVLGTNSLYKNFSGSYNTSIGSNALYNNTNGSYNLAIGYNAAFSSNYSYSTAIGYNSTVTANNQIVLGTDLETVYIPGSLDVSGSITSPSFKNFSDYRIKEIIKELDNDFTVDNLFPFFYKNKTTNNLDIGLIAHELQQVYPFLVDGEKDGEKLQTINYIGLIGILIKEIKDLKEKVNKLESPSFEI